MCELPVWISRSAESIYQRFDRFYCIARTISPEKARYDAVVKQAKKCPSPLDCVSGEAGCAAMEGARKSRMVLE